MTVFSSVTDANGYVIPDRINGNFGYLAPTTVTIATGAVTVNSLVHYIAGEGATTDALDTINGGKVGQKLVLLPASTGYVVTVNAMGSGNISMPASVALTYTYSNISLLCTSTGAAGTKAWVMLSKTT